MQKHYIIRLNSFTFPFKCRRGSGWGANITSLSRNGKATVKIMTTRLYFIPTTLTIQYDVPTYIHKLNLNYNTIQ